MQTPFPQSVNATLGVNSALKESSINSCKLPPYQSAVKEAFVPPFPHQWPPKDNPLFQKYQPLLPNGAPSTLIC